MVKQSVDERRNSIRAKRTLSIEYKLVKHKGKACKNPWKLSTTQDMSSGGLSFLAETEYEVGDVLSLRVVMSGLLEIYKGNANITRVISRRIGSSYLIAVKYDKQKTRLRSAKTHKKS